jgi:two-component system alkaline phosphatase synthesis response regulator PhoP
LEAAGYKTQTTNNGKDALRIALENMPRIVLLDVMLPGMSGLDVCNAIKAELGENAPPIIIISARGNQTDVDAGVQAGADDYLIKPFSPHDLLEHVESLIRG